MGHQVLPIYVSYKTTQQGGSHGIREGLLPCSCMMPSSKIPLHGDRACKGSFADRFVASVAMVVGMFALLVAASYPVMALTVVGATMTGFVVGYSLQQYRFHERLSPLSTRGTPRRGGR